MTEQKKKRTIRDWRGLAAIAFCFIAVGIGWLWASRSTRETVCPSRPRYETEFAISSYYEGTGSINFDATEEIAADAEEFGWLYHERSGGYMLYVDSRYDFQRVLSYLESWGECYEMADIYIDGRCYTDALTIELIHTGREVSCDDWETAVPTPTPEILIEIDVDSTLWVNMNYIGKLEIEDHGPILITGTLESIIMEGPLTIQAAPTMTPTPEPAEVLITDGIAKYSILIDGRYHAIPVCTYWEDNTQWLVSCLAQSPLRPQRKAVGIRNYSESTRGIFFDADPDVADEFAEFGSLFHTTSGWYELDVGSRYDFGEVLTYLENYPYKWECGILCDDWRDTDE